MNKIIVLGTGHATVKKCYNTCFALEKDNEYLLVDAGGGNQILSQLDKANISLTQIHHLFATHEHTDHILGVVWIVRMIATLMISQSYQKPFHIYCHQELVSTIQTLCHLTLQKKLTALFDDKHICFHGLEDGQQERILGHTFTFFDILSTKAKQFGFTFINDNHEKIVFTGDEPYNTECASYVQDAAWLLHEAFCLFSERDIHHPYEKHHSTVKDAANLATKLHAKHLILWHTEETHLKQRQKLYTQEAKQSFSGKIDVPNDLDVIPLLS